MMYRIRGAILIGIFLVSIISWPRSTSVTLFPHTDAGDSAFNFFKQVVAFTPLKRIGNVINVSQYSVSGDLYLTRPVVRGLWKG
jgi:AGZA family xanthine/uracil permease-like MFS transporter